MGEILGIGLSHYPGLAATDPDMASPLRGRLRDPGVPDGVKDPATWPELMRVEWGDDQGAAGAAVHREALVAGFDQCRAAIDDFNPDVVVIWGDDQYENFQEDVIPPFSILAYPDTVMKPWSHLAHSSAMSGRANAWENHAARGQDLGGVGGDEAGHAQKFQGPLHAGLIASLVIQNRKHYYLRIGDC